MVVLVVSDVHGNFHALQAVLEEAESYKYKELWFLGDLGGYGPRPEDCFDLLRRKPGAFLPGNHDLYLTGRLAGSSFSEGALNSLVRSRGLFTKATLEILKALPTQQQRKGITLVHGSPREPSTDYILSEEDAADCLPLFKGACCLFGHSHSQEAYRFAPGEKPEKLRPASGETVSFKKARLLANPGSVGQPRDRDPRAAWCLLNTRKKELTFRRTAYDIEATQREMRAQGAADSLIRRLAQGI